jgi:hypothetical protein
VINHSSVHLDDNTALRILSHLTHQLREEMPEQQRKAVQNVGEASKAVASFLEVNGATLSEGEIQALCGNEAAGATAQRILELLIQDESVHGDANALVMNPPDDAQRSVELAVSGAIILGALVAWLQTKVDIQVTRKNRETEFRFSLKKGSMGEGSLKQVAEAIRALLLA